MQWCNLAREHMGILWLRPGDSGRPVADPHSALSQSSRITFSPQGFIWGGGQPSSEPSSGEASLGGPGPRSVSLVGRVGRTCEHSSSLWETADVETPRRAPADTSCPLVGVRLRPSTHRPQDSAGHRGPDMCPRSTTFLALGESWNVGKGLEGQRKWGGGRSLGEGGLLPFPVFTPVQKTVGLWGSKADPPGVFTPCSCPDLSQTMQVQS